MAKSIDRRPVPSPKLSMRGQDETGMVNVIVSVPVWEMHKKIARDSGALLIRGMLENSSGAINVVAERIDRLPLTLRTKSRDFR